METGNPPLRDPGDYKRRVLICVVGQSPAVVTETLYALVVAPPKKGVKRFAPTEVKIITTAVGYEGVRNSLLPRGEASMTQADRLNGKGGEFLRLTADYPAASGLAQCRFDKKCVIQIMSGRTPLDDIVSAEDQLTAADTIMRVVRECAEGPQSEETAIHASIAGGRKSMGFFLGYCLSLLGRAQDRVSHVLVTPPFDECADFFYPRPVNHPVHYIGTGGASMIANANKASIELADIPTLRLSGPRRRALSFPADLKYSDLVKRLDAEFAEPELVIDVQLSGASVQCGNIAVPLTGHALAFYVWFAVRRHLNRGGVRPSEVQSGTGALEDEYEAMRKFAAGETSADANSKTLALNDAQTANFFSNTKNTIKTLMDKLLVPSAYRLAGRSGQNPPATALDALQPEQIRFTGPNACTLIKAVDRTYREGGDAA